MDYVTECRMKGRALYGDLRDGRERPTDRRVHERLDRVPARG